MGNATLQIKTKSGRSAISRANENLRASPRFENPKIVVVANNVSTTNFSQTQKLRLRNDVEISKKINSINSSIRTYEKRILTETNPQKILKMELKISSYKSEIATLKNQKSDVETRGRKKEKNFVELIMSLPGIKPQGEIVQKFIEAQKNYLNKFFGKAELVVNAVHLDQHSIHSHAILKIPSSVTWSEYLFRRLKVTPENTKKARTDALRQAYATMANGFQNYMAEQLQMRFDPLRHGIKYTGLKKYKLANPLEALKSTNEPKSVEIPVLEEKEILEPSSDLKQTAAQGRSDIADFLEEHQKSISSPPELAEFLAINNPKKDPLFPS